MASVLVSTNKRRAINSNDGVTVDFGRFNTAEEFVDYICDLYNEYNLGNFVFEDYYGVPKCNTLNSYDFGNIKSIYEFIAYDYEDREAIIEFNDNVEETSDFERILRMCCGRMKPKEYVEEYIDDICGDLPQFVKDNLNYNGIWDDLKTDGYVNTLNYVFDTNRT